MRFTPPTIQQRGQLARAIAAVQHHKPEHGEASGKIACTRCGGSVRFVIDYSGRSRGQCLNACGVRWLS